ncbi:hypothetical protein QCA50_020892 [Cerrena zonata]|uniref:UBC core domain-containing protein n=1 Tax=Cerrena zonata TaxID=2478898 RepID=A0AAW0FBA2_9APHY
MDREVAQLVEMGASPAQARAALKQYKDVMAAAERIFDGSFDHIKDDDEDVEMVTPNVASSSSRKDRLITPDADADDDEDENEDDYDEDDVEDFGADYESDYDEQMGAGEGMSKADPYAGIFFSKDRREEVIEVEEEPETAIMGDDNEVKLMTQGQWMKGCPEGGEQGFLFGLYNLLSESDCQCPNGCEYTIKRKKRDFFPLFSEFSTYTSHLQGVVERICPKCSKTFCLACGEPADSTKNTEPNDCLFHCPNLQGVILGVGLAMLESKFTEEPEPLPSSGVGGDKTRKRRQTQPLVPPPPSGNELDEEEEEDNYPPVGQTKKLKLGVGYAGDIREDTSGQQEALAAQRAKDEKLSKLLSDIRVFLPSVHRESGGRSSDYLVHPTTLAHLRRRFNFVSSQLLRNDSLADMSDRSVLYFELFYWLETISCHEALASMMAMPIMVVTSVKSVNSKRFDSPSSGSGSRIRERTIVYEGSSGPRELLEAIVIQAQAALKGLEPLRFEDDQRDEMSEEQKRITNDEKGKNKEINKAVAEENEKLLGFCKKIVSTAKAIDRSLRDLKGDSFVERMHARLPKIPSSGSSGDKPAQVQLGDSEESTQKSYIEWANRVRFEYCDLSIPAQEDTGDDVPHYKFYYNNEARMLASSDIPKRSLAIAKELAVLTTNLPVAWNSSIFLRVDETRVDIIKALITGPEGTPYYNGCYLFDIFLGPSYNHAPPSVKYMTTNGGKYRFNPNLYQDGKVCLSLLGTWTGPGWISGKSTLLQVLISIQSMILCEEPYLNEPGWANGTGTPQSKAYSANVRRMVVKTAMLGNLKNPPEPFADVIRTHFRLKARTIMKQLDSWLEQDDGKPIDGVNQGGGLRASVGTSASVLQRDVDDMKELLQKLMNGEEIEAGDGSGTSA